MKGFLQKIGIMMLSFSLIFCGGSSTSSTSSGNEDNGNDGEEVGDSNVQALQIGEQMSLVTATDDEDNPSLNGGLFANVIRQVVPTSGDYVNDQPEVYVFDESMEQLDTINNILCMIKQTRYSAMVNQGTYIALVDEDKCDRRGDRSSESSNQSSGQAQEFNEWVVTSTRADNDSDQVVQFWLDNSYEDFGEVVEEEIRAEIVISEGASEDNPFGIFTMNFTSFSEGEVFMTGHLSSSLTDVDFNHLQMVMDEASGFSTEINAILTPGEDEGVAYITNSFDGEGNPFGDDEGPQGGFEETVLVAFNASHYLTRFIFDEETKEGCLDRQNFRKNVWQYNLYEESGDQVEINGGFPIRTSEGYHGWASYWGIWLPEHLVDVTDGLEVIDERDDSEYTVQVGKGRLIRRTKSELTLDDIQGDTLQMWDEESAGMIYVEWDGSDLLKTAEETCSEDEEFGFTCEIEALEEAEVLDLEPFQWLGLWKQGLGGLDLVVPESGELSGDMEVPYYQEEFVSPSDPVFVDGELELQCVFECLKPNLTEDEIAFGEVFQENRDSFNEEQELQDPYLYTVDAEEFDLFYEGESTAYPADIDADQGGPYSWGVMTGAMVTTDVVLENPWEIWSQDVTYSWETGPNEWNKHTALLDSEGDAVEFDEPLHCLYQSEDDGTFFLEYNGEGELHGIPFEQVEVEEGSDFEHWVASFVLDNGTELTCNDGEEEALYYTKAMVVEQSMLRVEADECQALNVDAVQNTVGATTVVYEDPEIGERPEVTDAPAVIGGVLQDS
jgi:hypothetical protein